MADAPARGPLAGLGLAAAPGEADPETGLHLIEAPFTCLLELRAEPTDALAKAVANTTRLTLPRRSPETSIEGANTAFWMGPDRWWLLCRDEKTGENTFTAEGLRDALKHLTCAIFEITDAWSCIRVSGEAARDVLAKGCTIDLHPDTMPTGAVVPTLLAGMRIVLHHNGTFAYDTYGHRSSCEHMWAWLEDSGREYGVSAVQSPLPAN